MECFNEPDGMIYFDSNVCSNDMQFTWSLFNNTTSGHDEQHNAHAFIPSIGISEAYQLNYAFYPITSHISLVWMITNSNRIGVF